MGWLSDVREVCGRGVLYSALRGVLKGASRGALKSVFHFV